MQNRIPILPTRNGIETAQLIFILAGQSGKSVVPEAPPAMAEVTADQSLEVDLSDPRMQIIASLPEVGVSRAKTLLKRFGTLANLFAAGLDDLKKIPGIGAKRAEKIYSFLNGNQAA